MTTKVKLSSLKRSPLGYRVFSGMGITLLATSFAAGILNTVSIKDMKTGQDFTAYQDYALLGDHALLSSTDCLMQSPSSPSPERHIVNAEQLLYDDRDASNVALPLFTPKTAYYRVQFDQDLADVTFRCSQGSSFASSISAPALKGLWWVSILCFPVSLALLLVGWILRRSAGETSA